AEDRLRQVSVMDAQGLADGLSGLADPAAQALRDGNLEAAARALEEGLPSVALALMEQGGLSQPLLAARARLALGDAEGAQAALATAPESPERDFWMAEALALAGSPARALELYEKAASHPELAADARRGAARMLAALGRRAEAAAAFQSLAAEGQGRLDYAAFLLDGGDPGAALSELGKADAEDPARRGFLLARAAFAAGDSQAALDRLASLQSPGPVIGLQAALLRAEILEAAGRKAEAEDSLEKIIEAHPSHPSLELAFQRLDNLLAAQDSPSSGELRRWAEDEEHPRRAALASYYLGRNESRLGRLDRAAAAFERAAREAPFPALADAAAAECLRLVPQGKEPHITPVGPRSRFELAALRARRGEHGEAARLFGEVYAETSWPAAAENARLCAVAAGEPLSDPALAPRQLAEAEAFLLAPAGHEGARERLEWLAGGPGGDRARLALAEMDFLAGEPARARRELRQVSQAADPATAERAAALEVFLADDGTLEGAARVIAKADSFFSEFPNGPLAGQVAFKRGEARFRRGDFAAAREDFEQADAADADEGSGSAALLAALCAARSLDPAERTEALEMLDGIAKAGGPMASRARLEQAFLLNAENRPAESLAVLNALLESEPPPEIRWAALIEKGDTLFGSAQSGADEARQAIASWRQVADSDAPPRWRNQALAKIAAAHERLGETSAALAAAWRAMEQQEGAPAENFWSVKAGFDAARMLEAQSRLDEAMTIYEKLADRGGPRAKEARQRLERLRLENFLWDDSLPAPISKDPTSP
ncbi:MAG: tetratricopeptide repeat protein, partial [Terrimicrobiaceae bacterium]|nr:tetratricopeptide repeat protein [Terrimicrobiaceae bacterium]